VKKGMLFDMCRGIIAHLTRKVDGNVDDCHVVDMKSESFEMETLGANPHSGYTITIPELQQRTQLT
jgi:hypothetical protein